MDGDAFNEFGVGTALAAAVDDAQLCPLEFRHAVAKLLDHVRRLVTRRDDDGPVAVLLDVLPNGRPDDDRPPSRKSPVAYGLGTDSFRLYELSLDDEADVSVSDRLALDGPAVGRYREVSYDDLTRNAAAEVEYAVEDIVDADFEDLDDDNKRA